MKKHNEHTNFLEAYQGGAMKIFEDRWNNNYFQPLGLQIRIEPPGMDIANISSMDVASSKLFRYQHKKGTPSPAPGIASKQGKKKEYRYQYKEGRYRMKAIRKGRIVVLPFKTTDPISSQPRTTSSETQDGQSVVRTTTRVHPSAQDFAYLNQTQSSDGGLERNPVLAQRLTWSHQRQSNAEGLYRGYSEDDAERAPSPARAPTTHWGGYH